MKKKTKRKRALQLNRETLRDLHLREVRGGDHDSEQSQCDGIEAGAGWFCDREIIF